MSLKHGPKCMRCKARELFHGVDGSCPDGSGRMFKRHTQGIRASNSFSGDEIAALREVFFGLLQGKDVHIRKSSLGRLSRKISSMKATIESMKEERRAQSSRSGAVVPQVREKAG